MSAWMLIAVQQTSLEPSWLTRVCLYDEGYSAPKYITNNTYCTHTMTLSFKETKSNLCTRLRRVVFSSDLGKIDTTLGQPDNQIDVFSQCKNFL